MQAVERYPIVRASRALLTQPIIATRLRLLRCSRYDVLVTRPRRQLQTDLLLC